MEYMPDLERFKRLNTHELRTNFLVQDLFVPGEVKLKFYDLDRVIVGGIVPLASPLELGTVDELAVSYFTERREIGILNIGQQGTITVDGERFTMEPRAMLYIGRGKKHIVLESGNGVEPAQFYLVSYPAHATYPTTLVQHAEAEMIELGSQEKANRRNLYKYIFPDGVRSSQLVMGITEVLPGNVWNTMPPHTHARRTEVYMYFDCNADDVIFHFMGPPTETRNLVVRNQEAALSPGWSIHAGAGTSNYAFCWAMGGENQDFDDMQHVAFDDLA